LKEKNEFELKKNNDSKHNSNENILNSKSIKKEIRRQNPSIFNFSQFCSFIFEPKFSLYYYKKIKDNNNMKYSKNRLS